MMKRKLAKMNDAWGHRKITIDSVRKSDEKDVIYITGHDRWKNYYLWMEDTDVEVHVGETRLCAFDETAYYVQIDDDWEIIFDNEIEEEE